MRSWLLLLAAALASCHPRGSTPTAHVSSTREVGLIPNPPGASGRDVGFSVALGGHSAWIFGDTFFSPSTADGYGWRASTWSWTDDADASAGLVGWHHGLDDAGAPRALLPHTLTEQAFDDAHLGASCPAGNDCGARHTAWPGAAVLDPARGALVFYSLEHTEPTGSFAFGSVGASLAVWRSVDAPAERSAVAGGVDATTLFGADEPTWGDAAATEGDTLFAYACQGGGVGSGCRLARAPVSSALDRGAWQFFDGSGWSPDWRRGATVLDGAPLMSVHFNGYLGLWVAFLMEPLSTTLALRVAPRPEGPWSELERFAEGAPPGDGTWDYGLGAHPELAQRGGQVEYVSYFAPGRFLDGQVHLVEVVYR